MYDYRATVSEEVLLFNHFLSETIPQSNFIDLLKLIADENDNTVRLFTNKKKLISSIDRNHLTYFGAKEIGKILFEDPLLADLK